jgi:hypothetical protein
VESRVEDDHEDDHEYEEEEEFRYEDEEVDHREEDFRYENEEDCRKEFVELEVGFLSLVLTFPVRVEMLSVGLGMLMDDCRVLVEDQRHK